MKWTLIMLNTVTFRTDIHGPLRMNNIAISDPMFSLALPKAGQSFYSFLKIAQYFR